MKFELVHRQKLSQALFEKHPAWVEYYEPDDIERMVSEGFDFGEIKSALDDVGYSDDYLMPLINYSKPSPFEFTLYKSKVDLNDNILPSYLFVMENRVNSMTILYERERYTLNFSDPYFGDDMLELRSKLEIATIYPLSVFADCGANFEFTATCAEELTSACSRLFLADSK